MNLETQTSSIQQDDFPEVLRVFERLKKQWIGENPESNYSIYWIMRHQLIYSCQNIQQAEHDIELLITNHLFRQISLPLSHKEVLLFLVDDYKNIVRHALIHLPEELRDTIAEWLAINPVTTMTGIFPEIHMMRYLDELLQEMIMSDHPRTQHVTHYKQQYHNPLYKDNPELFHQSNHDHPTPLEESQYTTYKEFTTHTVIRTIIHAGILRRTTGHRVCITVPGTGRFVQQLLKSRQGLVKFINDKKSDILLSELTTRYNQCLAYITSLSLNYIVSDMIPLGLIKKMTSPTGIIVGIP